MNSGRYYLIDNNIIFSGLRRLLGGGAPVELAGDILTIGPDGEGLGGKGGTNVSQAPAWIPYAKSAKGKIYYISGFGTRGGRQHQGIDLAPAGGEALPIISPFAGVVSGVWRGWPGNNDGSGYGNWVEIQHDSPKIFLFYGHLKDVHNSIQSGAKVSAGQVIGTTGNTGRSTGPHLHWEVRESSGSGSKRIDPVAWTHANKTVSSAPPARDPMNYPEYRIDTYTQYDEGKIVRLGNKLYKINKRGALGDEVPFESGGQLKIKSQLNSFTPPKTNTSKPPAPKVSKNYNNSYCNTNEDTTQSV